VGGGCRVILRSCGKGGLFKVRGLPESLNAPRRTTRSCFLPWGKALEFAPVGRGSPLESHPLDERRKRSRRAVQKRTARSRFVNALRWATRLGGVVFGPKSEIRAECFEPPAQGRWVRSEHWKHHRLARGGAEAIPRNGRRAEKGPILFPDQTGSPGQSSLYGSDTAPEGVGGSTFKPRQVLSVGHGLRTPADSWH